MDIHPPHAPIRSMRDFMLQIFTVTCGIVIALALEGLVQSRNDEALAAVTREDFKAEISANLANLERLRPASHADFDWMMTMVAFGEAKLRHENPKPPAVLQQRNFTTLSKAAWDTALATQAIHRLRFEEARQLAETYNKQASMNDLTDHAEHQWVSLAAFGGDLITMPDSEVREGLGALRVAAAYSGSMLAAEDKVIDSYKAALAEIAK
jgi:hypothetical protein